jgi:hypothetical protein
MSHRWKMRAVLVLLIALEFCLLLLFAVWADPHLDKPGNGSTWYAWRQHPSPETEAGWNAEKQKARREEVIINLAIWSLIIGTGAGIFYVAKRRAPTV